MGPAGSSPQPGTPSNIESANMDPQLARLDLLPLILASWLQDQCGATTAVRMNRPKSFDKPKPLDLCCAPLLCPPPALEEERIPMRPIEESCYWMTTAPYESAAPLE